MDHISQDIKDWLNNSVRPSPFPALWLSFLPLASIIPSPHSRRTPYFHQPVHSADKQYYPWFAKWSGETFGPTGLGDSLYINLVAVRSDQRRRGVGKKLMRAALEQAEGEGVEVTLLSHEEENVSQDQRLSSCSVMR